MKKLLMIFYATVFIVTVACDNNSNRADTDNDRNPTTEKLIADENIPNNYMDDPTNTEYREPSNKQLPGEAREILENDEAFKNLRLESTRSFSRGGKTYYEIILEEINPEIED